MTGMAVATLGSAVIGGLSAKSASDKAAKAQAKSDALTQQGMRQQASVLGRQQMFNMERYMDAQLEYDKLKAIYGPLQEDLGTYFTNLTGESLSNNEVIRIQEASQKAKDKITATMAQSGRNNSGLESELLAMADYDSELKKAEVRSTAEERAIQAKSNFLNIGLGQSANIQQGQNGMVTAMQNSIYNPTAGLASMGQGAINQAAMQNGIQMGYVNQLQSLMGYAAKNNVFGSTGSIAPIQQPIATTPLTRAQNNIIETF